MPRLENWVGRLEGFLRENAAREFQFGEWDCCLFAAGAIAAMTGVDVAAVVRGQYDTREGGRQVLMDNGGLALFLQQAGLQEIGLLRAQRGDLVLVQEDGDLPVMGIVALNGREVLVVAEEGVRLTPIGGCIRAWRV